ncbi:MAG TPA: hypothetical protein VI142_00955 [Gaiellaceae bacterium]
MRDPAPPYRGEGPHALWHVSEEPEIRSFTPHRAPTSSEDEPLVWAIDTRHLPLYWFPRDCPRGTFWAGPNTNDADVVRFLGDRSRRVHAVEPPWDERMRKATLHLYRLPEITFEPYEPAGGYWISRVSVEPIEVLTVDDPTSLHERAGIELRVVPRLLDAWQEVIASTLEFSGIRLANARD